MIIPTADQKEDPDKVNSALAFSDMQQQIRPRLGSDDSDLDEIKCLPNDSKI